MNKACPNRDGDVPILFLDGMQVSFEIDESQVALVMEAVNGMIILESFGNFSGVYFIYFAKGNVQMNQRYVIGQN